MWHVKLCVLVFAMKELSLNDNGDSGYRRVERLNFKFYPHWEYLRTAYIHLEKLGLGVD